MDDSQFDAWTRRSFGVAAGSLFGSILGLARPNAEAKKKARKKKKKTRCLRLNASCNPNSSKQCCSGRVCAPLIFPPTNARCCNPAGTPCSPSTGPNCCSGTCNEDPNMGPVDQCFCKPVGSACAANGHCCSENCNFATNQCN